MKKIPTVGQTAYSHYTVILFVSNMGFIHFLSLNFCFQMFYQVGVCSVICQFRLLDVGKKISLKHSLDFPFLPVVQGSSVYQKLRCYFCV